MENQEYTIRFSVPYTFEGKTYDGITLAALDSLTAQDMFAAEAYANAKRIKPGFDIMENSTPYMLFLAARAAGLPVEFMEGLPLREATLVKYAVINFIN